MSNLSTYYHKSYDGGLNDSAGDREIARNEASLLHDWDITYQGQLRKRTGLTQSGDTISSTTILGLHAYLRTTGGKDLLLMQGTNLRYLNTSTWTTLDSGFTTGLDAWFVTCPLNDRVYIDNGTEYTHYWDRASTTLNSCLTDMGTTIPHGKVRIWHKNHMFSLNATTVSGTTYYNRAYFSNLGDPGTFTTGTDYLDVPGGGNLITAGDLGDAMVLFKERSLSFLTGWGATDWKISASSSNVGDTDESVGCIAKRGVTRVGNELWFIDNQAQIRRIYQTDFDAFRKDIVSSKIQGTIATINKAQLAKAVAWTHDDKVCFAVPTGSSTVPNVVLVYDIITSKRTGQEAWTTYTGWTPSCVAFYPTSTTPDLYLGDASAGKVYRHAGTDDNGTAIDSRWDGKEDDYDRPERYKRYKYGYVTGESSSADVDVGLYGAVDGGSFGFMANLNLLGSGSKLGPTGTFRLGPTGTNTLGGSSQSEKKFYPQDGGLTAQAKTFKMSIRHAVAAETATVNGWTMHYKERGVR